MSAGAKDGLRFSIRAAHPPLWGVTKPAREILPGLKSVSFAHHRIMVNANVVNAGAAWRILSNFAIFFRVFARFLRFENPVNYIGIWRINHTAARNNINIHANTMTCTFNTQVRRFRIKFFPCEKPTPASPIPQRSPAARAAAPRQTAANASPGVLPPESGILGPSSILAAPSWENPTIGRAENGKSGGWIAGRFANWRVGLASKWCRWPRALQKV
jgi:hypothetical protein